MSFSGLRKMLDLVESALFRPALFQVSLASPIFKGPPLCEI